MIVVPTVLQLAALSFWIFFLPFKDEKSCVGSPYPSACQRKTSQQFISPVLVLNYLHTWGLYVFLLAESFTRDTGHTSKREAFIYCLP